MYALQSSVLTDVLKLNLTIEYARTITCFVCVIQTLAKSVHVSAVRRVEARNSADSVRSSGSHWIYRVSARNATTEIDNITVFA